ncbi:hypothetical protein MRB53_023235 [Persea americana]|uniref:Uncharacterized protein n=1 Tax=Persea americana TaxID=3435 RepID=A0ACC2L9Y0_PERAE|nr:hypothetical protein MRB53_023235 [Persea americana]
MISSLEDDDVEGGKSASRWMTMEEKEFRIDTVARYVPSSFVTEEGFFLSNPVKHSLRWNICSTPCYILNNIVNSMWHADRACVLCDTPEEDMGLFDVNMT